MTFAVSYDVESLDPHRSDTIPGLEFSSHFYDGLVFVDANQQVHPALAASWETPDIFTWTFHIRPHVRFHSGKELTGKDVIYSFQRAMHQPNMQMGVHLNNVEEVKALDAMTVQIKTRRPSSVLLHKIRVISIVPDGSSDQDLDKKENGTGPYRLVYWKKGERIRMERNEQYWGDAPYLRIAEFRLGYSPEQFMSAVRSKDIGFVQCNSKNVERLAETIGRFRVLTHDSIFVTNIGFDLSSDQTSPNAFLNKSFRQAIDMALDRKALATALSRHAQAASQPVPPFVFGYDPGIPVKMPDREQAKKLIKESGWNSQSPRPILYVPTTFHEIASLLQQQFDEAEIPVKVEQVSYDQLYDLRKKGAVQSYVGRYGCMTGDASDLLEDVFSSPAFAGAFTGTDPSRYSHPTYTGPREKETIDPLGHRKKGLQAVISMFMEDALMLPICLEQDAYAIDSSYSWQPRYDSMILASEVRK